MIHWKLFLIAKIQMILKWKWLWNISNYFQKKIIWENYISSSKYYLNYIMTVMLLILPKIQIKEIFKKKSLSKLWGILGKNKNHLILCILACIWFFNIVSYRQWYWFSEHEGPNSSEALDCITCQSQGKFQLACPTWLILSK